MFRLFLTTSLMALAAPALADTFTGEAKVDTVTIYPGLATVSRLVTLAVPAGQHQITVPGLPKDLDTEGLRVSSPAGTQVGAVNLAHDRLPVTVDQTSADIVAARDEVERLQEALRLRDVAIAEIRLRVQAADEQIAFLQSLSQSSAGETLAAGAVADIQALAQMVGSETLTVRQAAFAAEQEALAATRAREEDEELLDLAQRRLRALSAPKFNDGSVLTFTLNAAEAGEVTIDISTLEGFANWSPVYDMRLTTGDAPTVDIDRAVVISQQTGQDWTDVQLILSTARPGEQIAPSGVWAPVRRIVSEEELERERDTVMMLEDAPMLSRSVAGGLADVAMEAPAVVATADFSGATVTYTYPGRVDIRNDVDDLRLPLDTLNLVADIWAEAVPSRDTIAYRVAQFTNTTDEVLLPGQALIFADGTMIGFSQLPLLAAGGDTEMGFGPLDGLRLTRSTPNRSEGDAGVFSSANQLTEQAVMTVENLTGQNWKVLLRDAMPYSEQDDLEVAFDAAPSVTRLDVDGQRGVLEWDLNVDAGQTQDVRFDYTMTWPSGYVLR